ncbi:MAG: hypothetical protein KGJ02_04495 [Verrucomicrobiota bacterium]|nr:hypothetical protein [Verrucomicrobiota bacterium]
MKRILPLLLAATLLCAEEEKSFSIWDYHPIHLGGNAIGMGQANISETSYGGQLQYAKSNAFVYALIPVTMTSYFFPRVEYNIFYLNWDKNPKFNQHTFQYTQFALTFYSTGLENWKWVARGEYNIDIDHFTSPSKYGLISALLWGSHQIHRKWHYHIGGLGYTGMEGSQIYPVIGADFSPNAHWTFLAIFPMDYNVQYKPNDQWRLSLKIRPLKERFRTGKDQPQPRSVFSYSSTGIEFNVHYQIPLRLELEFYGGYNFGGSFYIKDSTGNNALYTDLGGSPYGGITLDWGI